MARTAIKSRWPVALAVVSAVVLSVGVVYASIPDAAGVIHACYKSNGALRVIDDATNKCGRGETPLSWNQHGPPGEKGDKGDPGEMGDDGEPGSPGISGYEIVLSEEALAPAGDGALALAECPEGKRVLGGGGANFDNSAVRTTRSHPTFGDVDGWAFGMMNDHTSAPAGITAYAICAYVAE